MRVLGYEGIGVYLVYSKKMRKLQKNTKKTVYS